MARLGTTKKKKIPRAVELSQLKKELRRVSEKLESRQRELAEAFDQQTATSDILRMIAGAGTSLQLVMDAIAENAAKLCDAADAVVWRVDGEVRRRVAHFGPIPMSFAQDEGAVIDRGTPPGRAIVDRQTIPCSRSASSRS